MGIFDNRPTHQGKKGVPVWFMRQAGRYHNHYQNIKKTSDFMSMCKTPELARDVTMGPIEEFKFDAAILFSDLLFPLEYLGMGLHYSPGPKLEWTLDSKESIQKLNPAGNPSSFYDFQGKACTLLKSSLPKETTLLGFVGAPWTLYTYAAEGGHSGGLTNAKLGFYDGRWENFVEVLRPSLLEEMRIQAKGGADGMCLFDTAAGELDIIDYKKHILPVLRSVVESFKSEFPDVKVVYYSKHTSLEYLQAIECEHIDVLGIDWRVNLKEALNLLGTDYQIQGNIDPSHLHLPWPELEKKLEIWWQSLDGVKVSLDQWIAGLGHGVLQRTPEENVRKAVEHIHQKFLY